MARINTYVHLCLLAILSMVPLVARAQCLGDFNGDGKVSVSELVTAINNALDGCQVSGARFVDNGDGTVSDLNTGLQWEQKTTAVGSGVSLADPHDVDNSYTWSIVTSDPNPDGTAFRNFLATLNNGASPDGGATTPITGCLAGHCDWRLPTIVELQGILDVTQGQCSGGSGPCIDPTFGPTQAGFYWSATADANNQFLAWSVIFYTGGVINVSKTSDLYVRAVRGGS